MILPKSRRRAITLLIAALAFLPVVIAGDIQVWQGQYFKGTEFQVGTFEFNFTIYNASTGGGGVLFECD